MIGTLKALQDIGPDIGISLEGERKANSLFQQETPPKHPQKKTVFKAVDINCEFPWRGHVRPGIYFTKYSKRQEKTFLFFGGL